MKMSLVVVAVLVLLSSVDGATLGDSITGSVMRELLRTAGLLDTLNSNGPYTVFIPSDPNLERYLAQRGMTASDLMQDTDALRQFLLFHVVNGTITRNQLYNELKLMSLSGQTIRINNYAGGKIVSAQGVLLESQDLVANNGIIHYLHTPMQPDNGTVAEIIAGSPDLTTLMTAARTTGIDEFLNFQEPITVFAPTDSAFSALGDKVQVLLGQPDLLSKILKYHVVPGTLYMNGIRSMDLPTFEEVDRLRLYAHSGAMYVDSARLDPNGINMSATNGVVHKIDKVLIPHSLEDQI